jgi:hypothetical protein
LSGVPVRGVAARAQGESVKMDPIRAKSSK